MAERKEIVRPDETLTLEEKYEEIMRVLRNQSAHQPQPQRTSLKQPSPYRRVPMRLLSPDVDEARIVRRS